MDSIDVDRAKSLYDGFVKALETTASDKQIMAAAVLLVADTLATEVLFKDGAALTAEEMGKFLQSDADIDINKRAYGFVCGWIAQNTASFKDGARERFGVLESEDIEDDYDTAYIIANVFRDLLQRNGYSYKPVQAWLAQQGLLKMRGRNYTVQKRIDGVLTDCYRITLQHDTVEPLIF